MKDKDRCPEYTLGNGVKPRKYRCQKPVGHEGRCVYYRESSQGGTQTVWWGANPDPSANPQQVDVKKLLKACQEAEDPLNIVNVFVKCPLGVEVLDDYWVKRFCIVAEQLAERNSEVQQYEMEQAGEDW